MVVIEVRHRQGREADEEEKEKEKEEKEEKEEKRKAADIKSNNPHLAGGEKSVFKQLGKTIYSRSMMIYDYFDRTMISL